jgi:hypothetical protein
MATPIYLCEALSAHVPSVDFTPYFAFLESLPVVEKGHKHHILPRKEFPEFAKDANNIMRLSPADHFRAHYLLAVCAPQAVSFQRTVYMMASIKRADQINKDELPRYAEVYERGRVSQAEQARIRQTGRKVSDISKQKNREAHLGRKHTHEARNKIGKSMTSYFQSPRAEDHKKQVVLNHGNGFLGHSHSTESRKKIAKGVGLWSLQKRQKKYAIPTA